MPLITVYVRTGNTDDFKSEIAAGVQRAMIDVLGIPDDDYFQVTHELVPKRQMPYSVVKKACEDRGCYGVKKLRSDHLGRHEALNPRNDDVHINASKWVDQFTRAIDHARGAS